VSEAELSELSVQELIAVVMELREENARLAAEIAELKRRLEEKERSSKRQAAPFSKGEKKANPKKPGRKAGKGQFSHRDPPSEEEITNRIEVPLLADRCPFCGSSNLGEITIECAFCTDIPEPPQPQVTAYAIEVRKCLDCGRTIRGQHPQVDPSQHGATAHRLGDGVYARAHALHYGIGVPMRKVPTILRELCGVSITQSAIQQDALRRSQAEVGEEYERLRESVKDAKRVFTDDTGWRINGETAYLMGFDTDEATLYQIRSRHRNEEVREIIPSDYGGVMHTDRAPTYDACTLEMVAQQKCCYHIIRSIDKVLEDKAGTACAFGETLKALLQEAIKLWHRYHTGGVEDYTSEASRIKQAIDQHLKPRSLDDPDNQRLLDQIGWHHAGGNLLRFLDQPEVAEPTNNRAERILRPAVIARKVSHCSKNADGANAYAAFKTITETARKRGKSLVNGLLDVFRSGKKAADPTPPDPFPCPS
jgi:transposase